MKKMRIWLVFLCLLVPIGHLHAQEAAPVVRVSSLTKKVIEPQECSRLSNAGAAVARGRARALSEYAQRTIVPLLAVLDKIDAEQTQADEAQAAIKDLRTAGVALAQQSPIPSFASTVDAHLKEVAQAVQAQDSASLLGLENDVRQALTAAVRAHDSSDEARAAVLALVSEWTASVAQMLAHGTSIRNAIPRVKASMTEALQVLDNMRGKSERFKPYDLVVMWNYYAYFYSALERYDEARTAYRTLLDIEEGLIPSMKKNATLQLGQLTLLSEDYVEGTRLLRSWFSQARQQGDRLRAANYYLLAQGEMFSKDYAGAYASLQNAILLGDCQGVDTPEKRFLSQIVILSAIAEKPEWGLTAAELLAVHYPTRRHWLELQSIYGMLERVPDQLNVLYGMWQQGLLTQSREYIALAQHLQNAKIYYLSARILQEGRDKGYIEDDLISLRRLASIWATANELDTAVTVFKEASAYAKDGLIDMRVAVIESNRGNFKAAIDAYEQALERGGLRDRISVQMGLARCYFEEKDYDKALEIFQSLAEDEDAQKRGVGSWVATIENIQENLRRNALLIQDFDLQFSRIKADHPHLYSKIDALERDLRRR